MKKSEFIALVPSIKNGTYKGIRVTRSLTKEMKAAHLIKHDDGTVTPVVEITKVTSMVARIGVRYSHISTVAASILARHIDGAEADRQLPWGEWDPECPHLISHKGASYLRLTLTKNRRQRAKTHYFLNGEEISVEDLKATGYLKDGYWNRSEPQEVMTIKLDDVTAIV